MGGAGSRAYVRLQGRGQSCTVSLSRGYDRARTQQFARGSQIINLAQAIGLKICMGQETEWIPWQPIALAASRGRASSSDGESEAPVHALLYSRPWP